jgi:hypothetical protein
MTARTLPLFALNTVLIPGAPLPLHIFEQRYRRMVADLLAGDEREFVVLLIKEGDEVLELPVPDLPGLTGQPPVTYEVGTIARIDQAQQLPDGRSLLACTGRGRVRLIARTQTEPYPMGRFAALPDGATQPSAEADAVVERVRQSVRRVLESLRAVLPPGRDEERATLERAISSVPHEAGELSHFVARTLFTASNEEKQRLLEAPDPVARLNLALPLVLLEERLAAQAYRAGPNRGSLN